MHRSIPRTAALCGIAALGLAAGCSGGQSDDGTVEISWLVNNQESTVQTAEALIEEFENSQDAITVDMETKPSGTEGDNLVKTRLSTGEMNDLFTYNSGSLLQALNPDQTLVDLSDQPWVSDLSDDYQSVVSTDSGLYGLSFGTTFAGGIVYNQAIYDELGLEVPESWDDFMANNEAIAAAGYDPVIQTYGTTWTSQLFVLGDFANVAAADPDWAEGYTAHERFYAEPPALAGFEHLDAVAAAGYFNENFPSATFEDGARMLAEGTGVHYPILTTVLDTISESYPDAVPDIRFMAIPAVDPSLTSATIWQPDGTYIPQTTEGEQLDAALEFLEFLNSPEACDVFNEVGTPTGPYPNACELTDDVPPLLTDIQSYMDADRSSPALEFLSPIKGPNLENLLVAVGSDIQTPEEAAAAYDQDVEAQAQQLGIEGW